MIRSEAKPIRRVMKQVVPFGRAEYDEQMLRTGRSKLRTRGSLVGWLVAGLLAMLAFTEQAKAAGEWVPVGPMLESRSFFGSARLDDGRVLAVGGRRAPGNFIARAEIYNPVTGFFTPTGSLAAGRDVHDVVKLNDGRVLVPGTPATPNEIFDPSTGTFAPTGPMNVPRQDPAMALLPDGRVLIAGGEGAGNTILNSAEIYDPATGVYSMTGSMTHARTRASDARLNSGQILFVGGAPEAGMTEVAEIYNPATGVFTTSGSLNTDRSGAQHAITLADGRVMVTGGAGNLTVPKYEIFNPLTSLFNGFYIRPRDADPTISLLRDGTVLSAGELTEIVNPDTQIVNQFPGPFTWAGHDAVNLADGQVLVFGGPHPTQGNSVPSRSYLYYPNGLPKPTVGQTANLKEVSGKTFYTCPRQGAFESIPNRTQIRVGCQVDARKGRVLLTAAKGVGKKGVQSSRFWSGVFKVTQAKKSGETTLTLTGSLNCSATRKAGASGRADASVSARARKPKPKPKRKLWGKGKGRFKTKGKKGAAGVRGTTWYVEDRCGGTTLFRVRRGVVAVRDFTRKKTIRLKAGQSYVAGKRRR